LQNYPRTDKKKGEQKIQYTFELIDWFFFLQIDVETLYGDNLIRHLETFWTIEYFNKNPFTCLPYFF
jgi:hypothetical protein